MVFILSFLCELFELSLDMFVNLVLVGCLVGVFITFLWNVDGLHRFLKKVGKEYISYSVSQCRTGII